MRVHKPFHQKEAENRESNPSDDSQNRILRKQHRSHMVDEHRCNCNHFSAQKEFNPTFFRHSIHMLLVPLIVSWDIPATKAATLRPSKIILLFPSIKRGCS